MVTATELERQRRIPPLSELEEPDALRAETAVVGLVLDVGQVPPGLEAGARVAVFDLGRRDGRPLISGATVTGVSALPGHSSEGVRVGLKVPASSAGVVAVVEADDRVALAELRNT